MTRDKTSAAVKKETVIDSLVTIGFSKREARQFLPSLFLYLFRAFNQTILKKRAALINKDVNLFPFLSQIPIMGDLTLNDKVCLYARYHDFDPGVKPNSYIKSLAEDQEIIRHLRKFNFPPYTVEEVSILERRAVLNKEIMVYMKKFINRKMSFITRNYAITSHDLAGPMQERAIHNLRINYPNWKSHGDMLAMAKSAIANAGHNIIKFHAAEKRAKVDKENHAVEFSLEAMDNSGGLLEYKAFVYSDSLDKGLAEVETKMDIASILRVTESRPGVHHFLLLLAGRQDDGFTEFLGQNNAEYADEVSFDKLLDKTCAYVGVSSDKAYRILHKLGR